MDVDGKDSILSLLNLHNLSTRRVREIPKELLEIQDSSIKLIITYCILFAIATPGNLTVLYSILKQYKQSKSRIALLILHLSIADLIVCCTVIPVEVVWRITLQWFGGNALCKFCQFMRAFGLYLSSMVLICMSLDRFFAILFPLEMFNRQGHHRVKVMLWIAWVASLAFSLPQTILFSVESHPEFPSFKQCVTNNLLNSSTNVRIYSIFSVSAMYFIPLVVILFTYVAILVKLVRKTHHDHASNEQVQTAQVHYHRAGGSLSIPGMLHMKRNCNNVHQCPKAFTSSERRNSWNVASPSAIAVHPNGLISEERIQIGDGVCQCQCQYSPEEAEQARRVNTTLTSSEPCFVKRFHSGYARKKPLILRQSANAITRISRAKNRALITTIVIVSAFVICWTPYVVMTMWYILDWEGAERVDPRVQDGLFIMAIANSCVNPLIYGSFSKNWWGLRGSCQKQQSNKQYYI